jgi:hypothetical protein
MFWNENVWNVLPQTQLWNGYSWNHSYKYEKSVLNVTETTLMSQDIYIYMKAKAVPLHATKALGGRRYSAYSFSTSGLYGGEWSASRSGRALAPGTRPPVPTVQEAGCATEPVWTQRLEEESFTSAGDRTSIAQSSSS